MSLASCSALVLELFFRSFMSVASAGVNTEAKEVASVQNERDRNIVYQTEKPETRTSKLVFRVSNFILPHACLTTKYGCVFGAGLGLRPGYKNGAPDLGRNSK